MRDFLNLVLLCIRGKGGRVGLAYFIAILALGLAGVQVTVRLIRWTADFYNALQKLDVGEAITQIGMFFALTAISASLFLSAAYIRKLLQLRWRRALTDTALNSWLVNKAYWTMSVEREAALDNPDQRIAEDCRIFVEKLTVEAAELFISLVALFTYVSILWSLSTFPLNFNLGGVVIEIPRYMVWAAPVYVALASGLTHWLGKPLKALNMEQQRKEADFRFALVRLRENVEAVALMNGEGAERATLRDRFAHVAANWRALAGRELILGCFTRPYMQTVLRIPLFLALPAYLAGRVTFGGLMQIGSAFQNVVTTLSWFIFSYRDLAELAAASRRLSVFLKTAERASAPSSTIVHTYADRVWIGDEGVTLRAADGRPIVHARSMNLAPGGVYWIGAPSGSGKSTLLKAIAGLWRNGEGALSRPEAEALFTTQQVYLPMGDLHTVLSYPKDPADIAPHIVEQALRDVGLGRFAEADNDCWSRTRDRLSGGERQRVALARLLVQKPAWAFLDEATSALDELAEQALLIKLRQRLPETTFVVVAHRTPHGLGDAQAIDLLQRAAE